MSQLTRESVVLEKNNLPAIRQLVAIDLFCGSGAVSAGLKKEGFRIVAAVDNDTIACSTYRLNHPEVSGLVGNLNRVGYDEFDWLRQKAK